MKLLIDAGNSRAKWEVADLNGTVAGSSGQLDDSALFDDIAPFASALTGVAISIVASESAQSQLIARLSQLTSAPINIYHTESARGGLRCAYNNPASMGADRWHALYAAWSRCRAALVVVDAGSAITIDFVSAEGVHQGGYILPGRRMMLRGLSQDTARVHFGEDSLKSWLPGKSTDECVQHGMNWFWRALAGQLATDCASRKVEHIFLTGGDADDLVAAGLAAQQVPRLVLEGLARIDAESVP